jgi:hypothetical protein
MALTYVFDGLSQMNLTPVKGKSVLRFHLVLGHDRPRRKTVQFEVSAAVAMDVLVALQNRTLTAFAGSSATSNRVPC